VKRLISIFLCLLASAAFAAEDSSKSQLNGTPIKDFRLPSFDKDGKRTTFMRAAEALIVSPTRIDVKDMQFTVFTKDGTGAFDTLLLTPSATFLTDKQFVSGSESVRVIRMNLEITGEQWSYNHPEKRVLIGKNARVTFQDELKDIIK
jgi:hypothetical protein